MAAKTIASTPAKFTGFANDAMGFWHELSIEMNKAWFDANKPRYQAQWVAPMTSLLTDVTAAVKPAYRGVALAAPKVLRIYRDVRFAKDKTPYKTWIAGRVGVGGESITDGPSALYAHFGLDEEYMGSGQYTFMDDALVRWRKAIAADKTGVPFAKLLAGLQRAGYTLDAGETAARVPKPYAAEHPRAALLKMKGLVIAFPAVPAGLIHKPAFVGWLAKHAAATAPVVKWLHQHV